MRSTALTFAELFIRIHRFVPKVTYKRYVVAVSSCSFNVSGWIFAHSSISTVFMSVSFVDSVSYGSFYHIESLLLNLDCRRESFRFPSRLVSMSLIVVMSVGMRISLSRYRVNNFFIKLSTFVLSVALILMVKSHYYGEIVI